MDPVTMIYYATICAALGVGAPRVPGLAARLSLGAAVGLAAAALLPWLRGSIGI